MERPNNHENALDSCRSILLIMREYRTTDKTHPNNPLIQEALLEDLCEKSKGVPTSERAFFLTEGLYYRAPERIRELFQEEVFAADKLATLLSHTKQAANVGLITVIRPELQALSFGLGRDLDAQDFTSHGPFRYWSGKIPRHSREDFTYVLTMVGKPRNVHCALAVQNLLENYAVDLIVLIGIAAGPKSKVALGDAVPVEHVLDYEHVRSELDGDKIVEKWRPELPDIDQNIQNDLAFIDENRFAANFRDCLHRIPDAWLPPGKKRDDIHPSVKRGTSVAGERLFADGRLEEMVTMRDDRIRAGDQEDSGFAQACEFHRKKWIIFRGIADYGDPAKQDGWHPVASLSAACAALDFLTYAYRSPSAAF